MSRSYWRIILAALGCLIVAASPPRQAGDAKQAETDTRVANTLDRIASTLQNGAEREVPNEPCENGGEASHSDLCAQWKAAEGAQSGANATWLFGIVGSLIGGATLIAAIAAARYARSAAHAAMQSVRSTEKGLRQLERQSRRELRAYITVKSAELHRDHMKATPRAEIVLINTGQTPAYDVTTAGLVIIAEKEPNQPRFNLSQMPRVIMGHSVEHHMEGEPDKDLGLPAETSKTRTYIFGEVRYTDIFKETWALQFAMVSDRAVGATQLTSCKHGNRERRFKG